MLFRKVLEALIADERAKQHNVLADRLATHLQANGSANPAPLQTASRPSLPSCSTTSFRVVGLTNCCWPKV